MHNPGCKLAAAWLVVAILALPAAAATLEGRWLLVEETYGAGGLNLARNKPELTLEFAREGASLAGRVRLGPDSPLQRWPLESPLETPAAAGEEEIRFAPEQDSVRARYLTPENEDRFRLDVVEEYRVSEDGSSLTGTMTVVFLRGGVARGSFVLHRRFERAP